MPYLGLQLMKTHPLVQQRIGGIEIPLNEVILLAFLTLLTLPAFAWYARQARHLCHVAEHWLLRFRSWFRKKGRDLLRWLLADGD